MIVVMVVVVLVLVLVERQFQGPLCPVPTQVEIVNADPGWALTLSTSHTGLQYFCSPRRPVWSPPPIHSPILSVKAIKLRSSSLSRGTHCSSCLSAPGNVK